MTKLEFMSAYILARAGAISGTVTADKLVRSAAKVWQEIQYETGAEVRPLVIEAEAESNVHRLGYEIPHDADGVILDDDAEIGQ